MQGGGNLDGQQQFAVVAFNNAWLHGQGKFSVAIEFIWLNPVLGICGATAEQQRHKREKKEKP